MVLQLNGGEPVFQICQTARPIEFEAALRGSRGFRRSRLRQKLDECLHLLLRDDGQSFIFGDQCVFAHNKIMMPATRTRCNPTFGRLTGSILRRVPFARADAKDDVWVDSGRSVFPSSVVPPFTGRSGDGVGTVWLVSSDQNHHLTAKNAKSAERKPIIVFCRFSVFFEFSVVK